MNPLSKRVVEMGARMGLGLILACLALFIAAPAWADTPKIQRDQIADDAIGDQQIDWGAASEQVDASDVPVDDGAFVEITPVSPDVQACFDWLDAWLAAGSGSYWQRNGTDLSPATSGDDVLLNDGELIKAAADNAADIRWYSYVTGDSYGRFQVKADGTLEWGPGSGAVDTALYRSAANKLASADAFVITNSDYQKTIEATNGITGSTNSSYGIHGTSTGGPILSAGVYGTSTSSTATTSAGVMGYANASGTNEFGGWFDTAGTASGLSIGVFGSTSGSGNDDYGGKFNKTKAGAYADFDDRNSAASPRAANAPPGDGRLYCSDDATWSFIDDAGMTMGFADADGDTKIQVEEGDDDDTFRIDIAASEEFTLDATKGNFNCPLEVDTKYIIDGTDGIDASGIVLITDVDFAAQQVKYRTLTWEGGILTACSAESAWTPAPLNP